jgi:phenylalanyl-tRNA synthetase alpha chain
MSLADLATLETDGLSELKSATDEPGLRAWQTRYFGDKGLMKAALAGIGKVPKEDRARFGQEANRVKVALESAYAAALEMAREAALNASLSAHPIDVTLPGRTLPRGRLHPATQILREIYPHLR